MADGVAQRIARHVSIPPGHPISSREMNETFLLEFIHYLRLTVHMHSPSDEYSALQTPRLIVFLVDRMIHWSASG